MIDVVVIDLSCADSINEFFLEDCALNKVAEQSLNFLFVWKGGIDFIRFILEGSHLTLYCLQMVFEVVEHLL